MTARVASDVGLLNQQTAQGSVTKHVERCPMIEALWAV